MKTCSKVAKSHAHDKKQVKIKQITNTHAKAHNIAQMRRESRQLHCRHKTSNIFPIYMFRRINEALLNKERVHNFPFRLIEINGGMQTTTQREHRKSVYSVNLNFFRLPPWSTNSCMFLPAKPS
jgi:hypothetical protein